MLDDSPRAISVSSLAPDSGGPEPAWVPLEFGGLLNELRTALNDGLRFEFEPVELTEDTHIDRLERLPRQIRERTDLKIVHLIGHGERRDDGFLHLIPPSGRTDDRTELQHLCAVAQSACADSEDRELLLVIDVCHAGGAVDRLGLEQLDRVWVAVAATPSNVTYDGIFTRAFTAALNDIAAGRTDTDAGEAHVSMSTFRGLLGTHLNALGIDTGHYGPRPKLVGKFTATPDPRASIFPNRNYSSTIARLRQNQARIDPALREYLDDGLDIDHFDDRVGPHFTGRRTILRELGTWITDHGSESNLGVVTGSGGVGKSAILGAIVLTQHPQILKIPEYFAVGGMLRDQYPAALNYDQLPGPFAAVHARQLRAEQVTESISGQLAAQVSPGLLPEDPTPDGLIEALGALPEPPLLLIDALDEAIGPNQITDTLLRGLLHPTRPDGRATCRLLIACRNETDAQRNLLASLETSATAPTTHDLDETPADELREDLFEYMHKALRSQTGEVPTTAQKIAAVTAETLTNTTSASTTGEVESAAHRHVGYGSFLVATLFARYLQRTGLVSRPEEALANIPRTLPQVLEMDLADEEHYQSEPTERRALLAALAHARGQGMPASIAGLLARKVFGGIDGPEVPILLTRSTDIKIYLRTSVDPTSGETLYRLFHQALVDHLLKYPRSAPELEAEQ